MFVPFVILAGIIAVAGPGHNEGGFQAIKDRGFKAAVVQAIDEADASTLHGNYGNK